MATFLDLDPSTFKPQDGRGAWVREGIDYSWRYEFLADAGDDLIGRDYARSLDHWAIAAGCEAIRNRLTELDCLIAPAISNRGVYTKSVRAAVRNFQADRGMFVDGTVGRSDAKALFTPIIDANEKRHGIPSGLLRGEVNAESALDPGAVGYYIYYPKKDANGDVVLDSAGNPVLEYRGVDRGICQINSLYNPQVSWLQAFDPNFAIDWSGNRLRSFFDKFKAKYPKRSLAVLWDAALCAHNNPSAAAKWAELGMAPTEDAAKYVAAVKAAIY